MLFPLRGQLIPFIHQVARLVASIASTNVDPGPCLAEILTTGNLIAVHKLSPEDRKLAEERGEPRVRALEEDFHKGFNEISRQAILDSVQERQGGCAWDAPRAQLASISPFRQC